MMHFQSEGRKKGVANKANVFPRNKRMGAVRITEGFMQTLKNIVEVMPPGTSQSDVLHEAVKEYGLKKLTSRQHLLWLKKVI